MGLCCFDIMLYLIAHLNITVSVLNNDVIDGIVFIMLEDNASYAGIGQCSH